MLTTILLLRANTDREKRAIILPHTYMPQKIPWVGNAEQLWNLYPI